ncbi:MAG TPA: hypothetical protein VF346_01510 [Bacteroidales bacterium]
MENKLDYSDDIKTIKKIMEESSRFLSLSGLSGLFAGFLAILGACIAHFGILRSKSFFLDENLSSLSVQETSSMKIKLITDAILVLLLALAGSLYFSYRKARRKGQKIWTPVSRRLLLSLIIPLIAGAFFIMIFYQESQWQLIVPAMLIFYGLALISAGKFTYSEVFYLGLAELLTGFSAAIFQGSTIFFWILGFGFFNIAYGLIMYRKYEG